MTRDDILSMAREADLWVTGMQPYQAQIEKFAALVAAHEREACAKVCDSEATIEGVAQRCAEAIRDRGEK